MGSFLDRKIDRVNIKIDYLEELLERVKANKQDDLIRDIKKKIVLDELEILNKELNKLIKRKG
jgi:predicted metal-dependent hydrolase|tara:strand:- start:849 stop:1037 length:189 start_codon:yes stop_codon:yes gene_type:complete